MQRTNHGRRRQTDGGRASVATLVAVLVGCEAPLPVGPACSHGWVDVRLEVPVEPDDIDLVIVVDPSRSMDEDRERVLVELTRTLRVYVTRTFPPLSKVAV